MYGTWNRAQLSAGTPSASNKWFINSEMWLLQSATNIDHWVEIGMKHGYFKGAPGVGHRVFGEWSNNGTYGFHSFGPITLNDTATDEFQISREVTSPEATSHLFAMHAAGLTQSGAHADLDLDVPSAGNATSAGTGPTVVYGQRPAESQWKWKVLK